MDIKPNYNQLKNNIKNGIVLVRGSNDDKDEFNKVLNQRWNSLVVNDPAVIVRPVDKDEIVVAVNFARENALPLGVRGGAHSTKSVCVDGLFLDLSQMRKTSVDVEKKEITAESGCTLGDIDRATLPHGLVMPMGHVSHTGIAGLCLGGGFGHLSRTLGLTIDHLEEVELVGYDGEVKIVSKSENEDLFFGIRGCGHNFGVVTKFRFSLSPLEGGMVLLGTFVYPLEASRDVLIKIGEFENQLSNELALNIALTPDGVVVMCIYNGNEEAGRKEIDQYFGNLGNPVVKDIKLTPYSIIQTLIDDKVPQSTKYYQKGPFLNTTLTPELVDIFLNSYKSHPTKAAMIIFTQLGGKIKDVPVNDTSYFYRDAIFQVMLVSIVINDDVKSEIIQWTGKTYSELSPYISSDYINTADSENNDLDKINFYQTCKELYKCRNRITRQDGVTRVVLMDHFNSIVMRSLKNRNIFVKENIHLDLYQGEKSVGLVLDTKSLKLWLKEPLKFPKSVQKLYISVRDTDIQNIDHALEICDIDPNTCTGIHNSLSELENLIHFELLLHSSVVLPRGFLDNLSKIFIKSLPSTVSKLNLDYSVLKLNIDDIPQFIETLIVRLEFVQNWEGFVLFRDIGGKLPKTIRNFEFCDWSEGFDFFNKHKPEKNLVDKGSFPEGITYLKFNSTKVYHFLPYSLPSSLKKIEINSKTDSHFDIESIPSSVQELYFKSPNLSPGVIPNGVKFLEFFSVSRECLGIVADPDVIPPTVTTLRLLNNIFFNGNQTFVNSRSLTGGLSFPQNINSLKWENKYPLQHVSVKIPESLTKFSCYLDNVKELLPQSIRILTLKSINNIKVIPLPTLLTHLSIKHEIIYDGYYDRITKFSMEILGGMLRNLNQLHTLCISNYNDPIFPGMIPDSVRILNLGLSFNQPLVKGALPSQLEELILNTSYDQSMENTILPSTLKYLHFKNHQEGLSDCNPNIQEIIVNLLIDRQQQTSKSTALIRIKILDSVIIQSCKNERYLYFYFLTGLNEGFIPIEKLSKDTITSIMNLNISFKLEGIEDF
eukprot:gene4653-5812_t